MRGKCKICNEIRGDITYHSLVGHHLAPFLRVCQICHLAIHSPLRKRKEWEKMHKCKFPVEKLKFNYEGEASRRDVWVASKGKRRKFK